MSTSDSNICQRWKWPLNLTPILIGCRNFDEKSILIGIDFFSLPFSHSFTLLQLPNNNQKNSIQTKTKIRQLRHWEKDWGRVQNVSQALFPTREKK